MCMYYILFFLHFEYRILQDMFNLHILLSLFTLFVVFHRTGHVQWENIYVLQSLFTLSYVTVFYRTFSIEVSQSLKLS